MDHYFELTATNLLNRLAQVKVFIKKHNPTIGVLTEEIIKDFLEEHLPKYVSIKQGFIIDQDGNISKQCDILIYDSTNFAPIYRIKDIVIIPEKSVIAVIEVKTTITKQIFHKVIDYFTQINTITNAKKFLFIYNPTTPEKIRDYFLSYRHIGDYQQFDHDTFYNLPTGIIGLSSSFYLEQDNVSEYEGIGYSSRTYVGMEGTEINALLHFFEELSFLVTSYISDYQSGSKVATTAIHFPKNRKFKHFQEFELFNA